MQRKMHLCPPQMCHFFLGKGTEYAFRVRPEGMGWAVCDRLTDKPCSETCLKQGKGDSPNDTGHVGGRAGSWHSKYIPQWGHVQWGHCEISLFSLLMRRKLSRKPTCTVADVCCEGEYVWVL